MPVFFLPFRQVNNTLKFFFQIKFTAANIILFSFALLILILFVVVHFKYKSEIKRKWQPVFFAGIAGFFSISLFMILDNNFAVVFKPLIKYKARLIIAFFPFAFFSSALYSFYNFRKNKTGQYVLAISASLIFLIYVFPVFSPEKNVPLYMILKLFKSSFFTGFILLSPLILTAGVLIHVYVLKRFSKPFLKFACIMTAGFAPAILWYTAIDMSSPLFDFSAITYGTAISILWIVYQIALNYGAVFLYTKEQV